MSSNASLTTIGSCQSLLKDFRTFMRTPSNTRFSRGRYEKWEESLIFISSLLLFCTGLYLLYTSNKRLAKLNRDERAYRDDPSDPVCMHMALANSVDETAFGLLEIRNSMIANQSTDQTPLPQESFFNVPKVVGYCKKIHFLHRELGMLLGQGCQDEDIRKCYAVIGMTPVEYLSHVLATYDDLYRSEMLQNVSGVESLGSSKKEKEGGGVSKEYKLPSYKDAVYGKFNRY